MALLARRLTLCEDIILIFLMIGVVGKTDFVVVVVVVVVSAVVVVVARRRKFLDAVTIVILGNILLSICTPSLHFLTPSSFWDGCANEMS